MVINPGIMEKLHTIVLISFLMLTNCKNERINADTYGAKIPFSYPDRGFGINIIKDSAFSIFTSHTFFPDVDIDLTIFSGKIYRKDDFLYAKDDLSGEIILFTKDDKTIKLHNIRYFGLIFEKEREFSESNQDVLDFLAHEMKFYNAKTKDQNPNTIELKEIFNDSIVEFSNDYGLSLIFDSDSIYNYTIDNLVFTRGLWQIKDDTLIFDDFSRHKNTYPSELYDCNEYMLSFVQKERVIYKAWMVNDSTLFMGSLPFARACLEMQLIKPGTGCRFFQSLLKEKPFYYPIF